MRDIVICKDRVSRRRCLLAGLSNGGVIDGLAGFQGDAVAVGDEAAGNGQDFGAWHDDSDEIQWIGR